MAKNRKREKATQVNVPVPAGTESGDPVLLGDGLPAVALTDRDSDGNATVQTDGSFDLPVEAVEGGGDIAVGDILFIADGDISDDDSGARFGYSLGAVDAENTEEIEVKIGY